jgi:hypothetical protein
MSATSELRMYATDMETTVAAGVVTKSATSLFTMCAIHLVMMNAFKQDLFA